MSAIFLTQYDGAFLGPIAKVLGWILEVLANFLNVFGIMNVGITIVLFTFIVNALMVPLTLKQNKFSKLQSRMAPELTRIQKKYKGKKDEASIRKQQMETQAVYQKYGSSPTAGCLPMLITLPIMFALYRVIYHIPAYVNIYYDMYRQAAEGIMNAPGFTDIMQTEAISSIKMTQQLQVPVSKWAEMIALGNTDVVQNNLVEFLSQLRHADWGTISTAFQGVNGGELSTIITNTSEVVSKANTFLGGLSVVDAPGWGFPGVIVPIAAAGFQFLQVKMMPQPDTDPDNPTAATMKSMNTVMPIMSGIFCLMLPLGVGLYWVAGSVFRIIQQFFVNQYMDRVDVDTLIQKNIDKQNKKREKRGLDPVKLEDFSKTRTSSIDVEDKVKAPKKNVTPTDYKRNENAGKAGSISGYANLLNRSSGEKGDK